MEGNIVATYQTKWGICEVSDAAYAGKTPEEIAQVRHEISATVHRILARIVQEGGEDYETLMRTINQK